MANKSLRQLLNTGGCVVAPGVYDAIGARLAQQAGFEAVYMTGNGAMASLLGKPDLSLATQTEMVMRARQLAASVDIPLISDADTGYGSLNNVRRSVQEFETAGVAAIHIEDQIFPKRCGALGNLQIAPLDEALQRIRVALDARRSPEFLIIARTDARGPLGLEEAIRRGQAFASAGADLVMVELLQGAAEIGRVCTEISAPILYNIYEDKPENCHSVEELQALGVRLVINCLTATLAVSRYLKELMLDFRRTGSTRAHFDELMTMAEYTHMLGIARELELGDAT